MDEKHICYFCGEIILATKGDPRGPESLCFHSLDGNHDNWDPANKVPAHMKHHNSYHSSGDKNPMYGNTEAAKKVSETTKGRRNYWMEGDKNPMKNPEVVAKWKGKDGIAKKVWKLRRELYPPNGMKPRM